MRATLFLLLLSGLTAFSPDSDPTSENRHPFYISVCQIDHNPDQSALEITFKIFTDDLEQALEAQGTGALRLGTPEESREADQCIRRYLENHVDIAVNGKPATLNYLGKEIEADVVWLYVESKDIPDVRIITMTSTLLLDMIEEQTNLVHIKVKEQRRSMILNRNHVQDTIEFSP
jgi:hypothetical protein